MVFRWRDGGSPLFLAHTARGFLTPCNAHFAAVVPLFGGAVCRATPSYPGPCVCVDCHCRCLRRWWRPSSHSSLYAFLLQWLFDGLLKIGSAAVPINMLILGNALAKSAVAFRYSSSAPSSSSSSSSASATATAADAAAAAAAAAAATGECGDGDGVTDAPGVPAGAAPPLASQLRMVARRAEVRRRATLRRTFVCVAFAKMVRTPSPSRQFLLCAHACVSSSVPLLPPRESACVLICAAADAACVRMCVLIFAGFIIFFLHGRC